jgi:hypothetical protein
MSDGLTQEQIAQLKSQADASIKAAADKERAEIEAKAKEQAKAELAAQQEREAQAKKVEELTELVKKQQEAAAAKEKELLAKIDQLASSKATVPQRDPFANPTPTNIAKKWEDLPEQKRSQIEEAHKKAFFGNEYEKIFKNQ